MSDPTQFCSFHPVTLDVTSKGQKIIGKPAVAHIEKYDYDRIYGLCVDCLDRVFAAAVVGARENP